MRKIDAFAHILPRAYLERLERQLEHTMAPSRLDYYREGVFSFDPVLTDLDARWRKVEPYGDYAQVLVLAGPPLEEVGPPQVAAELARLANDELAQLVQRFGDRFAGFAAALPLSDVDLALRQLVIAHHGGGLVPHFSARLAMGPGYRQVKDTLPRPPLDYFRRFHVDTALFGAPHAVRCVLEFFGPRHVLFGTDMPLGPANAVEATIGDIDAAGLSREDRAAVYSGTAVRLLGLLAG
jgi:predicted TIM-barrel fold metal-dependent hydrolase